MGLPQYGFDDTLSLTPGDLGASRGQPLWKWPQLQDFELTSDIAEQNGLALADAFKRREAVASDQAATSATSKARSRALRSGSSGRR